MFNYLITRGIVYKDLDLINSLFIKEIVWSLYLLYNHYICWRTSPLITKHWLIRGTLVLMYIDYVTYFNRIIIVTNPNKHIILYVLRALGPDYSMYYLSNINTN
jgi:hypothetical protein